MHLSKLTDSCISLYVNYTSGVVFFLNIYEHQAKQKVVQENTIEHPPQLRYGCYLNVTCKISSNINKIIKQNHIKNLEEVCMCVERMG